jgi:hypothetical protein
MLPDILLHPCLLSYQNLNLPASPKLLLTQGAMAQEYQALISNGTWTLCPRPINQHVLRNRQVYKIKQQSDGSIDRFKARLVAKGFEQQSGVDYTETFSSDIKPSTI